MTRQQRYDQRIKFRAAGVPIPEHLIPRPLLGPPLTSTHPRAEYHRAWRAKRRDKSNQPKEMT